MSDQKLWRRKRTFLSILRRSQNVGFLNSFFFIYFGFLTWKAFEASSFGSQNLESFSSHHIFFFFQFFVFFLHFSSDRSYLLWSKMGWSTGMFDFTENVNKWIHCCHQCWFILWYWVISKLNLSKCIESCLMWPRWDRDKLISNRYNENRCLSWLDYSKLLVIGNK